MNNKIFYIFFIIFLPCVGHFTRPKPSYVFQEPASEFTLARSFETNHSYIGVVRHKKTGKLYIVKQKKIKEAIPWCTIQAILAYEYAYSTNQIISQRVYIIPKNIDFPGKKYKNEFASLHSIVPGMSVKSWQQSFNRGINLKKVRDLLANFWIKLEYDGGVDMQIIENMCRHNDLPPIVALHLLVGFYDCHKENIFYDYHSNRFSIIDMDNCYKYPIAFFSYQKLKNILTRKETERQLAASPRARRALLNFADMIELMIERNPIEKMQTILKELFALLKVNERYFNKKTLLQKISNIKPFLQQSYEDGKKIVMLIRRIFQQYEKKESLMEKVPPRYCITNSYDFFSIDK